MKCRGVPPAAEDDREGREPPRLPVWMKVRGGSRDACRHRPLLLWRESGVREREGQLGEGGEI